jgi:hypothetical protein
VTVDVDFALHLPDPHIMSSWDFCLDIGPPNIRANLPENLVNILLSGQNDLINQWLAHVAYTNERITGMF